MSALTGNLISDSYHGLLKSSNNQAITNSLVNITDGNGNSTPFFLSTETVTMTGSVEITGSLVIDNPSGTTVATLLPESLVVGNAVGDIGTYTDMHGIELYSGSNYIDITVNGIAFNDYQSGSLIAVSDNTGNPHVVINLQNYDNWTNGNMDINVPLTLHSGSIISGSVNITGSLKFTPSSSFVLPVVQPSSPVVGTAFFSGSHLYIYDGSAFKSASFA